MFFVLRNPFPLWPLNCDISGRVELSIISVEGRPVISFNYQA